MIYEEDALREKVAQGALSRDEAEVRLWAEDIDKRIAALDVEYRKIINVDSGERDFIWWPETRMEILCNHLLKEIEKLREIGESFESGQVKKIDVIIKNESTLRGILEYLTEEY